MFYMCGLVLMSHLRCACKSSGLISYTLLLSLTELLIALLLTVIILKYLQCQLL